MLVLVFATPMIVLNLLLFFIAWRLQAIKDDTPLGYKSLEDMDIHDLSVKNPIHGNNEYLDSPYNCSESLAFPRNASIRSEVSHHDSVRSISVA